MVDNIDLIGKRFGRLIVIEKAFVKKVGKSKKKRQFWKCKCDCGNIVYVDTNHLNSGHTKSCGCLLLDFCHDRTENLIGQRFGKLTVIEKDTHSNNKKTKWICKCDCGNIVSVFATNLKKGNSTNCGCVRKETCFTQRKRNNYKFYPKQNIGIGYDNKNNFFIFDLEDYNKIKDYTWVKGTSGHWYFKTNNLYIQLTHVLLPEIPKSTIIDHIDRDPDNNRKINLRPANKQTNAQNCKIPSNNTSGVIGVSKTKEGKWRAYLSIKRKQKHLGVYVHFRDAIVARLKAEKEYFNEFAPQKHLYKEYGI